MECFYFVRYDGYETDGYSIAYYVENYKAILDSYGVNLKDARLLTYSEVVNNNIGCDYTNHTCSNTFVADTSFWLGSGHDCGVGVLFITSTGSFDDITNVYDQAYGVRPVIVIAKSDM